MAIRNIVKHGDDVLTKKCRTVEVFDERLSSLIDDMFDTLYESGGVGLAAPQVGVLKRVVVIDLEDDPIELVNPEIIEASGEQYGPEGCLSYPGQYGMVKRPNKVKIKAQDRHGDWYEYEGEELLARAFCHETDHLDGNMFMRMVDQWLEPEEQ